MAVVHHLSSLLVIILLVVYGTCKLGKPSCVVKDNNKTHNCIIVPVNNYCNNVQAQRYLEHSSGSPGVKEVLVSSKVIENGTLYVSLEWKYESPKHKLRGFLLQLEIIAKSTSRQYIIVKHKSKAASRFQFSLDNIQIAEVKAVTYITISVWTLIGKKTRKLNNDNRSICRVFAEKYEDYKKVTEITEPNEQQNSRPSQTISKTQRHIQEQHADMSEWDNKSCSCLSNTRFNIVTNTSGDIWIHFGNSCANAFISIDPKRGNLWSSTVTKNSTQCENDECCGRFADVSDGNYIMKVLYKCFPSERRISEGCSLTRHVTVTRPLLQHRSSTASSNTSDKRILVFVIVPVALMFSICAFVAFFIFRKKKKHQSEDIELPLLQRKVLFISCRTDSTSKELEATKEFERILKEFGVETVNATDIFDRIYGNNDIEYLANLKDRLDEEVKNYKHFIFITTKDLYESYRTIGRVTQPVKTLYSKDHDWHHYLLAGQIITYLRQDRESNIGICHFVALEESALKYQQKICSFVKLTRGRGRRYCLSKIPKFNVTDCNVLLQSLPTSLQNNELVAKIESFNSTPFLQILKRAKTHNQDPGMFHPPKDDQTNQKISPGEPPADGSTVVKSCIDSNAVRENSNTRLMPDKNCANNPNDEKTSNKCSRDEETMAKFINTEFDHTVVKDAAATETIQKPECSDADKRAASNTTCTNALIHSTGFNQPNPKSVVNDKDDFYSLPEPKSDIYN